MEFLGTKGEKWVSVRSHQGVSITIGPVENLIEDGIADIFTIGLSYTPVTQSIKAKAKGQSSHLSIDILSRKFQTA